MKRLIILVAAACGLWGCGADTRERTSRMADELVQREQEVDMLERTVASLEERLAKQQLQIVQLQGLDAEKLDKLFTVERIKLGRYSGGYSSEPGGVDEGIRVYLQPIDSQGSVIKAAGDATVEVFDLASEGDVLVSRCRFPVDEIGQHWYSGAFTYHYALECPWGDPPPTHRDLTVRVEFVDYLTGRRFSQQKEVRVKLNREQSQTQPSEEAEASP